MLLAHTADLHLSERPSEGGATLEEQVETLLWIGRDAAASKAELMLVAGDVFHGPSTPAERNAVIRVFREWALGMPVVVVYGNHDRPGDLDFLSKLRTELHIRVAQQPEIWRPDVASHIAVACLPWPRKAWLAGRLEAGQDLGATAAAGMRAILAGFGARAHDRDCPFVLLSHAELGAALMDNGQPVAGKCDIELNEGDLLDIGADYVALGHIHKHQILGGGSICYAGSPRQTNFGEDPIKGYCLVDIARGRPPVIEHRRAPGRVLFNIKTCAGYDLGSIEIPDGSAVRLSYSVNEEERHTARAWAEAAKQRWLAAGAWLVKIDEKVLTTHRVRSEAIREAHTTADRVEAWWATTHRPERANQILAKLSELERDAA